MTSCLRCWPPMWPRRWGALTKSDWVGRRPWTWCTFANDLRRCIYMYFSAFNPKQAGADVDDCYAAIFYSIAVFEWLTGLYYVNTNIIRISIRRNWLTSSGQWIDLVRIIIHFLRCIASRNQPAWSRHNIVDNVLFLAILSAICPQEIFSTILSTTYFLSGLCVWRIYVYFLIICYDIWRYIS